MALTGRAGQRNSQAPQPVQRAVSTRSALSPRSLLSELFYYTDRESSEATVVTWLKGKAGIT